MPPTPSAIKKKAITMLGSLLGYSYHLADLELPEHLDSQTDKFFKFKEVSIFTFLFLPV
jgi:hypothetical protein